LGGPWQQPAEPSARAVLRKSKQPPPLHAGSSTQEGFVAANLRCLRLLLRWRLGELARLLLWHRFPGDRFR
jgi:hypothetical protein